MEWMSGEERLHAILRGVNLERVLWSENDYSRCDDFSLSGYAV
jgi:hypothetical protein